MKSPYILTLFLGLGFSVFSQISTSDLQIASKIRNEAETNSKVEYLSYQLLDYAGPRLAASDGQERGYEVAKKLMTEFGLSNARIEFAREWRRGGWDLQKCYMGMTQPYYIPIFAAPVGWTNGTSGLIKGEVVLMEATTLEDLQKLKGSLKGKIILMPSRHNYKINFTPLAVRYTEESLKEIQRYPLAYQAPKIVQTSARNYLSNADIIKFLQEEEVAVILNENGEYGVPGITFYRKEDNEDKHTPCEMNLSCENHGLMERLIKNKEKVEVEIEVAVKFHNTRKIYNVIAEIPGSDPKLKSEIVMIGAHIDSYHMSPGAGDNGAGCMAMLEAMRILKDLKIQPKRTIRIALWGGEEVGLNGSKGYVEVNGVKNISSYFNSDYGPGKFRGIYTQGNLAANPIFKTWMQPFEDMDFTTVSNRSVCCTDHMPFDEAGVPAFQFIQDGMEWGRHSHRTQDFADRLVLDDIRHNAVIIAWFAYQAAMKEEGIPKK